MSRLQELGVQPLIRHASCGVGSRKGWQVCGHFPRPACNAFPHVLTQYEGDGYLVLLLPSYMQDVQRRLPKVSCLSENTEGQRAGNLSPLASCIRTPCHVPSASALLKCLLTPFTTTYLGTWLSTSENVVSHLMSPGEFYFPFKI